MKKVLGCMKYEFILHGNDWKVEEAGNKDLEKLIADVDKVICKAIKEREK